MVDKPKIRPNRHNVDIMEPPHYKPLRLIDDFKPSKTCKEYVEQDCAEALPVFRPYCKALVECSCEVSLPPRCPVLSLLPPPCLWDTSRSINQAWTVFICRLQMTSSILNQGKACGLDPQEVLALVRLRLHSGHALLAKAASESNKVLGVIQSK
jgi:hypothetical protein